MKSPSNSPGETGARIQREGASPTGGQINVAGILYQMLRSLQLGLDSAVAGVTIDEDELVGATLTVEPAQGGDVSVTGDAEREIEQIKMRRGQRPWTAKEIAARVLPDLFKTAGATTQRSVYRFVTDQDRGTESLRAFLKLFAARPVPTDPAAALDDTEKAYKFAHELVSARQMYAAICGLLGAASPESRAQVWDLLANLDIVYLPEDTIVAQLDAILAVLVDAREEVAAKRNELVGAVLELAKSGGGIRAGRLLEKVGLDPQRLTHIRRLPDLLKRCAEADAKALGYQSSEEVRGVPAIPDGATIVAFTGESGQGKTWRLCRSALAASAAGHCVVLVRSAEHMADVEREIVDRVWLPSYDNPLPLQSIAKRLRPALADQSGTWLTLYVNDVHDRGLAQALATTDWTSLGIRVVVAAQPRIASHVARTAESWAEVPVSDFSMNELRAYLSQAKRDLLQIPDDVLLQLTRPVLASIYCRTPGSERWTDANEYQVFASFWRFATNEHRGQDDFPSDAEAVKALAGSLLTEPVIYPWPTSTAVRVNLDDNARRRLIAVGLLRQDPDGKLVAVHDRLLNWMLAEYLCDRFSSGAMVIPDAVAALTRIKDLTTSAGQRLGHRLGYVLLDLLWLLVNRHPPELVGDLIVELARAPSVDFTTGQFFTESLPTLGANVVPALVHIARQHLQSDQQLVSRYIGAAIAKLGETDEQRAREAAIELIGGGETHQLETGLAILADVPAPEALDTLWSLNTDRAASVDFAEYEKRIARYHMHEASFKALVCATRANPNWLRTKLGETSGSAAALELLRLLMRMDPEIGRPLWENLKSQFFARIKPGASSLPRAIRYFVDRSEIDRLEVVTDGAEDSEPTQRVDAMVRLDPNRAIALLDKLSERDFWRWSGWIIGLIHRGGRQAQHALLAANRDEARLPSLAMLYHGIEELIDTETFECLLDGFEALLSNLAHDAELRSGAHLLQILASARTPELIARLEARRGSRLERLMTERAVARSGPNSISEDRDARLSHRVLLRIGGAGFDELVVASLRRESHFARIAGMRLAKWSEADAVRAELERMAADPRTTEQEYHELTCALAAHGADTGLFAAVDRDAPAYKDAVEIRLARSPFDDEQMAEVVRRLESDDPSQRGSGKTLIAFSGRPEAAALLIPFVENAPPDGADAARAVSILDWLDQYDGRMLPVLSRMLQNEKTAPLTAQYLADCGDSAARAVAVDWLASHTLTSLKSDELQVAFALLAHDDSAIGARAFLKRLWRRGFAMGSEGHILTALAEGGDTEAEQELQKLIYRRPQYGHASSAVALEAVARTHPEEAFDAAQRLFNRTGSAAAARLIMTIDPGRGTDALIESYSDAITVKRWVIARALRWYAPRPELLSKLATMSQDARAETRASAAELAGWLPQDVNVPFLNELVDDNNSDVEWSALSALRRRKQESAAVALLATLPSNGKLQTWSRLTAAVDLADPHLVCHHNDVLSLTPRLGALPAEFRITIQQLINQRTKDVESLATQEDNAREQRG